MSRPRFALALAAAALLAPRIAAADPITRDQILQLAQPAMGYSYWWGHGAFRADGTDLGSCSGSCPGCSHTGNHGADCSGLVAKVWQIPSPSPLDQDAHPYSTVDFKNGTDAWDPIDRGTVLRGDALVHNDNGAGHIFLYESGDPWGDMWAYECRGCAAGCVHNLRSANMTYIAIRRRDLVDPGPPDGGAGGAGQGGNNGQGGGASGGATSASAGPGAGATTSAGAGGAAPGSGSGGGFTLGPPPLSSGSASADGQPSNGNGAGGSPGAPGHAGGCDASGGGAGTSLAGALLALAAGGLGARRRRARS